MAATLVLVFLAIAVRPGESAESHQAFLDALRRCGYFDEAVMYLEQMRADPRAPKSFQETIDYELAMTLLDSSRATPVAAERGQRQADARLKLAKFLADHPHHLLAFAARTQLANLLVQRGRRQIEQATALARASEERNRRMEAARKLFHEAENVFLDVERETEESLKKFGFVDPKNLQQTEAREQVRRQQVQARLDRVWVLYEITQTYEPGSAEHKSQLTETADKFGELYAQHKDWLSGLYARMGQGRCYRDLGDNQKAFSAFEELLTRPDEPEAFRSLKSKAAVQALETAMLPDVRKYKQGLEISEKWVDSARRAEASTEAGLAIRYLGGEAALAYAQTLSGGLEQAKLREQSRQWARDSFAFVADVAGPYQAKARIRLLDPMLDAATTHEPTNFSEARDHAKAALDRMAAAEADDKLIAADKNAEGHRNCRQRVEAAREEAKKYCQLALRLRAADVSAEDLNAVRYYLAYLYFHSGDMPKAASLGESLATGGDAQTAREGAKIALAAYDAMLRAASAKDRQSASEHLLAIANVITKHWDNQPEADEARLVLLQAAVRDGRLDQARQYLRQIPIDSARRSEAELCIGQAMWTTYLRAVRLPESQRPPQAKLERMAQRAQQILTEGVEPMRKSVEAGGPISSVLVASVLSLAQIELGQGHPELAIQWLADPKIGAKTLVDTHHPATQWGDFPVETYKVELRAAIAARQTDKAEQAFLELENLVRHGGDDANRRLTQVCIGLGRDLQQQVEQIRSQASSDPLSKLLQAFDAFLSRAPSGPESDKFHRLHWMAETSYGIATGLDSGGPRPPPEAEKYYRKAAKTFNTIIQRCETDRKFAPQPEAAAVVEIQAARCVRRLGQYREALSLLLAVLKETTTMVDAQVEAAYTYQAWGAEKPEYYEFAIQGGQRYREVWGWGEVSRRVQSAAQYQDTFYEARYNLALCRFRQAQSKTDPEERDRLAKTAENDILVVQKLYPELGGKSWHDKFDDLLKQIRQIRNHSK